MGLRDTTQSPRKLGVLFHGFTKLLAQEPDLLLRPPHETAALRALTGRLPVIVDVRHRLFQTGVARAGDGDIVVSEGGGAASAGGGS